MNLLQRNRLLRTTAVLALGCLAAWSPATAPAAPVAPATEAFGLIGTATFPGGAFAVFDGTRGEFKTYVHPGEMIGDCRLVDIQADRVRLATPAGEIELPMDKQLRRDPAGAWQLSPLTEPFTAREQPAVAEVEAAPALPAAPAPAASPAPAAAPIEKPGKSADKLEGELSKIERKLLEASQSGKDPRKFGRDLLKKVEKQAVKEARPAL